MQQFAAIYIFITFLLVPLSCLYKATDDLFKLFDVSDCGFLCEGLVGFSTTI